MTSCQEVMVLIIWKFWKRVSWELTLGHVNRQLGCLPQWQTVEVGVRPWWREVGVRPGSWELTFGHVGRQLGCLPLRQTVEVEFSPWCLEVWVRPGSWDFEVGPWKTIVEFLPLGHRVGFRPLNDVVSIVWLGKNLRIVSLSPCRSTELRSF